MLLFKPVSKLGFTSIGLKSNEMKFDFVKKNVDMKIVFLIRSSIFPRLLKRLTVYK